MKINKTQEEFNLSEKIIAGEPQDGIYIFIEDVKEFIKKDTEFLDINKNLIGFKLSEVVVFAINKMFSDRTKRLAGEKLK